MKIGRDLWHQEELNTHLARHTIADLMLNNGIPPEDVSKMLGHKNNQDDPTIARVREKGSVLSLF